MAVPDRVFLKQIHGLMEINTNVQCVLNIVYFKIPPLNMFVPKYVRSVLRTIKDV